MDRNTNELLKKLNVRVNIKSILKDLGSLPITKDYIKELGADCDFRELPISPSMIQDCETPVVFNHNVTDTYRTILEYIGCSDLAAEFPFVVLGNRKSIDGESVIILEKTNFLCDLSSTLSSRKVGVNNHACRKCRLCIVCVVE